MTSHSVVITRDLRKNEDPSVKGSVSFRVTLMHSLEGTELPRDVIEDVMTSVDQIKSVPYAPQMTQMGSNYSDAVASAAQSTTALWMSLLGSLKTFTDIVDTVAEVREALFTICLS